MNQLLLLPVLWLVSSMGQPPSTPMPDPSSVYCAFLGYRCGTMKEANGEYGICTFPDGSSCRTWEFFRGQCGQEFSYCALKGCETLSITEERGSYTARYCACSCTDPSGKKDTVPLMQFMAQHGDTLIRSTPGRKGDIK